MKISVAMATYNGEKYVIEQLNSILSQSLKVDEVIICDDRSDDNTVTVINEFIQKNNLSLTWKLFVNEENLGYADNFMNALDKTSGDYIMFCDQDDIWIENRVENMIHIMESNEEIMLLGSEFEPFGNFSNNGEIPKWELAKFKNDNSLEKINYEPKNIFIGCQGCTMCVRRDFYTKVKKYRYSKWAHDEFVWKMALCMDGLYFYHAKTLKRRVHDSNVSLGKMRDLNKRIKFVEDLKHSHEQTLIFAEQINLNDKKLKILKKNIKASQLRIDLLRKKRLLNVFPLVLCYADCYHKKRAIPVEFLMAIRG